MVTTSEIKTVSVTTGAGNTSVYEVPSDTQALIKNMHLYNTTASFIVLTVYMGASIATGTIFAKYELYPNQELHVEVNIIMEAGEDIVANDGASATNVRVTLAEMVPVVV